MSEAASKKKAKTQDELERAIKAALEGDEESIGFLLEHFRPNLYAFAQGICRTPEDAEDATQHALFVISQKISLLEHVTKVSSWAFAIVKHECFKLAKRASKFLPLGESAQEEATALDKIEVHQLLAVVRRSIAMLEPVYREVLVMRDIELIPASKIAIRLNISIPAVKSRLHRARALVKQDLQSAMLETSD